MIQKKIGEILLGIFLLCISVISVNASSPSFSLYPSSGLVEDVNEGFTVDILIDSGSYDISKARAVIKFDPRVVQLRSALRNNTLFEQWPTDESTTDNTRGILMLTGYTTAGGTVAFYNTGTSPDVFARLEFDVVSTSKGEVELSFEYTGDDELFQTVLLDNSDPEVNVLLSEPSSATFILDSSMVPSTAIDTNTLGVIIGVVLILVGVFVRSSKVNFGLKRRGTVVLNG